MFFKERPNFETIRLFGARYPQFDFSAIEAFVSFAHVAEQLGSAMDEHFARHNLSRGRFFILMLLMRSPEGVAPAVLAESCGVTRATVTGLVDTLEAAGLVARSQAVGDRRGVLVTLTESGKARMDEFLPDHYRRVSSLMRLLSESERAQLVGLLGKIDEGVGAIANP